MSQKIAKVQISNFLGIEQLAFQPGEQTLITGGTGAGKTSVLEAIQAAFSNNVGRPRLVHDDDDEAVLLVETDRIVVERKFKQGQTAGRVKVSWKGGGSIERPQSELDKLFGPFSFNPVEFLALKDTEQSQVLLGLLTLELSDKEKLALGGGEERPGVYYDAAPLQFLTELEQSLAGYRKDLNRDKKEAAAAAQKLSDDLPEGFDPEEVRGLSSEQIFSELHEAQEHNKQREQAQERVDYVDAKIAELQEQRACQATLLTADILDIEPLQERAESYDAQKKTLNQFDQAAEYKEKAAALDAQAQELSALLKGVRAKPQELVGGAESPIPGLSVDDEGNVTIDGRPVKGLSTGESIGLAVKVAEATVGELQVILVDGLERLDPEVRDAFLKEIEDSECQYIMTQVTEGPLQVEGEVPLANW